MNFRRKILVWLLAGLSALPSGCTWRRGNKFEACAPPGAYERVASEIEYPIASNCTEMNADPSLGAPQPWTVDTAGTPEYWDVSLEQVIQLALAHSKVMRDLGGAVVRVPGSIVTTFDPAIAETDPRFGIEAALSEFDAQFQTSMYWERNDRAFNNEFFGGGSTLVQQELGVFQTAITKRAATGDRFTIRHNVDYDASNQTGNLFPSAWNTNVEMEMRHPFLQGGGVQYNRIAGLDSTPGVYDGVLIARLNADVALNDFEIAVRDLVSNVENAYWDLYYGYRVLDARVRARDAALDTWRKIYALNQANRQGGEAEKEAQAREQFFRFQQDVQNALSGEPYESSRNWNGLPSGAFRTTGGVLMAERRLRLLMGLPPSGKINGDAGCSDCTNCGDGVCGCDPTPVLLRPMDEPVLAKICFDWCEVTQDAATRRAELRRQKWLVRRRELELMASKNHLLPRLDGVGRYRWRGFGDDLFPVNEPPLGRFDSAYSDLLSGDFQEWQLGVELSMPIGFRQAHVAARNAELLLARERAILQDQQREVIHEAADAVAELDRAYSVLQTSYNRLVASRDQLGAVQTAYENDKAPLDLFLDAQRRLAEAEIEYASNRTRYSLAAKNVHFVKGTLLEYDGVFLSEGPWPGEAYCDAAKLESRRGKPKPLNYASRQAPVVSRGVFPQHGGDAMPMNTGPPMPVIEEELPSTPTELQIPPSQRAQPVPASAATTPLAQPDVVQTSAAIPDAQKSSAVVFASKPATVSESAARVIHFQSVPTAEPAVSKSTSAAVPRRLPRDVDPFE